MRCRQSRVRYEWPRIGVDGSGGIGLALGARPSGGCRRCRLWLGRRAARLRCLGGGAGVLDRRCGHGKVRRPLHGEILQPVRAVAARAGARGLQSLRRSLGDPAADGLLRRAIRGQGLLPEHRLGHRRRIPPLPVLGKVRGGALQRPRSPEHIEAVHGLQTLGPAADARFMLLRMAGGTTISQSRPRGRLDGRAATPSYQPQPAFPDIFQSLAVRRFTRCPLSKVPLALSACRERSTFPYWRVFCSSPDCGTLSCRV